MTAVPGEHPRPAEGDGEPAPVIRDKRRIDPQTGEVRRPDGAPEAHPDQGAEQPAAPPADSAEGLDALGGAAAALAEERLADLQRLQAEYVNYRKRVERDRNVARDAAVAGVLEGLLSVLDDIDLARQHGDLDDGPFAAIAEKLEMALGRYGLVRYGEVGEEFDPAVHEALLHAASAEVTVATVTQVLQPGYRMDDRVLRPARVGVTSPE